ncbi:MAG: DUF2175 domain-containing protein [Pyrobaculum sp.]
MRQFKKWTCVNCGGEIIEGQLFTFYSRGPAHWECFEKELSGRLYKDVELAALLRLDHYLHGGIVLAKQLEHLVEREEVRNKIVEIRKQLEAMAARLTGEISR